MSLNGSMWEMGTFMLENIIQTSYINIMARKRLLSFLGVGGTVVRSAVIMIRLLVELLPRLDLVTKRS